MTQFLAVPALLLLSACGAGSGDGNGNAGAPAVTLATAIDVAEGDSSPLADAVDTQTLQEVAARNAAQGIAVNLTGAQRLNQGGSSVLSSANLVASNRVQALVSGFAQRNETGLYDDVTDLGLAQIDTSSLDILDIVFEEGTPEQTEHMVNATLGLGEDQVLQDSAQVERTGNRITIDPDDILLCAQLQANEVPSVAQRDVCQQLVSNLTVRLDAVTEQRGEINYLYDNQPLLAIAYGPLNAAYTLNLGTLHAMERYAAQLSGTPTAADSAQHVQGSVRLQSKVFSDRPGEEAGSLRVEVVDTLQLSYPDGSRISLAPSLLLALEHNDARGTASVEIELGAMDVRATGLDSIGLQFNGFTGRLDMDDTVGRFTVSNLGFVNGPLRLSDNDGSSLNLGLQAFAFVFEEQIEELIFNNALSMALNATLRGQDFDDLSFSLNVSAPAGTKLDASQSNQVGSTVLDGGPLQLDYSLSSPGGSENGFVSWSTTGCQSGSTGTPEQSLFLSVVDC